MLSRSFASLLLLSLPFAAACDDSQTVTKDAARLITASGPHVVVAASSETTTPSLGCGGGGDPQLGPGVLFVSDDTGATFERIVPENMAALTRIGVKDGVFYGIAQEGFSFAVMTSGDGRTWTKVAAHDGEPHDLSISDGGLAIAYSQGVLTSTDGSTWLDHPMTSSLYAPSVVQVGEQLVVGSAADGSLHLATGNTWTTRSVYGMTAIWELIPAANALLVTGTASFDAGPTVFTIARVDLASDARPTYADGFTTHPVVTPAGLLDTSGELAPIEGNSVGALAPFVDPFESAIVDGQNVRVLRSGTISTSVDGGRTFGTAVALPIVSIAQ